MNNETRFGGRYMKHISILPCAACASNSTESDTQRGLSIISGAQGHTREQDDRREGLGAHHAYCRALGGDV